MGEEVNMRTARQDTRPQAPTVLQLEKRLGRTRKYYQLLRAQLVSEGYVLRFSVKQASDTRTMSRAVNAICLKRGLA